MGWYSQSRYPAYVSIAERKEQAEKQFQKLGKTMKLNPIVIPGRTIASTFWGRAWCKQMESYHDYENRLPRGRSYVRNGFVFDLSIEKGLVKALVQGSSLYTVTVEIKPCSTDKWKKLIAECSGKIDSLVELLQGKFSKSVMEYITNKEGGLFPQSKEINFDCSCPDYATMCKHVSAVLYGIGARLDTSPEDLFLLRHVDHLELIKSSSSMGMVAKTRKGAIQESDLSALFDIEIEEKVQLKERLVKTAKVVDTPKKGTKKTGSARKGVKKAEEKAQLKGKSAKTTKVAAKSTKASTKKTTVKKAAKKTTAKTKKTVKKE
jgi:uncharacterized Zn finger protein